MLAPFPDAQPQLSLFRVSLPPISIVLEQLLQSTLVPLSLKPTTILVSIASPLLLVLRAPLLLPTLI